MGEEYDKLITKDYLRNPKAIDYLKIFKTPLLVELIK